MPDQIARIDAVATIIFHDDKLQTVYNHNWGAFTLPMTKPRNRRLGLSGNATRWERGAEAALRNVAECLGITATQAPGLLLDVADLNQSDRSGQINHYHFQVYGFEVTGQQIAPGVTGAWLTPDQILDESRQPISPTARTLVEKLKEAAITRKGNFPPVAAPARRQSVSSIGIISQERDGGKLWLCQWNRHWGRYFLVGGHQKPGETPEGCLIREMQEELEVSHGTDYAVQLRRRLQYTDWSASAWQQTDYDVSTFDVTLQAEAVSKIDKNAANRWLTADEIRSERCTDDRLVSPTARRILQALGQL